MPSTARARRLSLGLSAALLAGLLPTAAPAAAQQQPQDRGIARACPDTAEDAFADDDGSVHEDAIDCIAFWDIARGTGGSNYSPSQAVSRAQMASFIAKMMEVAGFDFAADPEDAFADDEGSVHEDNINKLADAGVVEGTGPGRYSPTAPVSRAQMASFINKAIGEVTGSQPSTTDDFFTDDEGSVHEGNINALASIGVVTGVGGGQYAPTRSVTRAPMAAFVARGADFLAEKGFWPPPPGESVGPIEVSPGAAAAVDTGDSRTFTAQVDAGTVVDIRLFPSEDIRIDIQGRAFFADTADPADVADENASTATITSVSGVSVSPSQEVNDITSTGQVTFTITASRAEEVYPVVWVDADDDEAIDLFTDDRPSESFGIGGLTTFIPPEAAAGRSTPVVANENIDANLFVSTNDRTYNWDANDTFQYRGQDIKIAEFESMLNPDDVLDVNYEPEPAARSVFNLTNDVVHATPPPRAAALDADEDGSADDVQITITFPQDNSTGTLYDVERTQADCDGSRNAGLWTTVAEDVEDRTVVDTNVPPGCYVYRIEATSPISGNEANSEASNAVQVPGSSDTSPPQIEHLDLEADANTAGTADTDDVFEFFFSEPMADSTETGQFQVSDPDGTIVIVRCAGDAANATCELNAAPTNRGTTVFLPNEVLTVTLTAAPETVEPGDTARPQYPLVLRNVSADFKDRNGNVLTLVGSDTTIEKS